MTDSQVISDVMDPARASALCAVLGLPGPVAPGDALPPFFHQVHFWDPQPPGALGRDGHPKVGGLIPDTGLPRRMWAGGRLAFAAPLRAGVPAEKHSRFEDVTRKSGRSGALAFVTLRHEIRQEGQLCLTEWQDLVYRPEPDPSDPRPDPPRAPETAQDRRAVQFSPTLLFRYSALTFNGHRIHYDETYARLVEGYEGLVVHGPLLAQLMMLMAEDLLGPLAGFSFRGASPLMHHGTAELCRDGRRFWVRAGDGRLCMTAAAEAD